VPEIKTRAARPLEDSSVAVGEIMNTEVGSIKPNATASFWSEMRRRGIGHLVVMDYGQLRGVVSERDFGRPTSAVIRTGRMAHDLMRPTVVSVESTMILREAASLTLTYSPSLTVAGSLASSGRRTCSMNLVAVLDGDRSRVVTESGQAEGGP
jgi:predicted transcriptional regulator